MTLKNETYDKLKWIAQIALPAAATLYAALAGIWGLPHGTEITGTISAVDAVTTRWRPIFWPKA